MDFDEFVEGVIGGVAWGVIHDLGDHGVEGREGVGESGGGGELVEVGVAILIAAEGLSGLLSFEADGIDDVLISAGGEVGEEELFALLVEPEAAGDGGVEVVDLIEGEEAFGGDAGGGGNSPFVELGGVVTEIPIGAKRQWGVEWVVEFDGVIRVVIWIGGVLVGGVSGELVNEDEGKEGVVGLAG